ncbi:sigma-70 family RNA polymerase sigma factor [Chryseobacterium sp. PBS4-4]|uniref:Sigma-70 family RNA polymerase sigma factor n=1 Tax=Chryseobacterium edaphi TaxID=2976532 RepID=A0ABT2W728_9FLAO|nr:sigma-70 family RNA polymerase sigma factor [Chryseobacterium edaphi]MCU7618011.1 sigma-70 family RNA polymerase sigma factor [Chryseobacterium edaphi]
MSSDLEKKFIDVFKENQRIVHKICRIYTNNSEDHEDLFQEITIQLWKSYSGFRRESKFSTWMYQVALNTAMTLSKKSKKYQLQQVDISFSSLKIKEESYEDDEHKLKEMYQHIYRLSDIEKALIMMYLDNKSFKEIGDILGITEGNARVKMNRAKNNLKSKINAE